MKTRHASVISSNAELLLTSSGVTTSPVKERLLEMGRHTGDSSKINVLRIDDGWRSFDDVDSVGRCERIEHAFENFGAKLWSRKYLRWALGSRLVIKTVTFGNLSQEQTQAMFKGADLLVIPGGNTYQVLRGIKKHEDVIKEFVAAGLPYIGESAGSIVAGRSITPASLEPADICPDESLINSAGLGLVDADVLVHIKGATDKFEISGPLALMTKLVLSSFSSEISSYIPYGNDTWVYALNEQQALNVQAGSVQVI